MTNEVKPGDCFIVTFYYFICETIEKDELTDSSFIDLRPQTNDLISIDINEKLIVLEVIPFNEETTYLKVIRCKTKQIGYTTYSSAFLRKL